MTIVCPIGTREEIVRMASIITNLKAKGIPTSIIDVGEDSGWFMKDSYYLHLNLPEPVHKITYKENNSNRLDLIEDLINVIEEEKPSHILISSYSNTALALAYISLKIKKPIISVQSGCNYCDTIERENNSRTINSAVHFHYATNKIAVQNLIKEGISRSKILEVGSTAIDALTTFIHKARTKSSILNELEITPSRYLLLDLIGRDNLQKENLISLREILKKIENPVVFPIYPSMKNALEKYKLYESFLSVEAAILTEPFCYLDFLRLEDGAKLIITDSSRLCEEATYLGKPMIMIGRSAVYSELVEAGVAYLTTLDEKKVLEGIDILCKKNLKENFKKNSIFRH